jgi:hypothetical protein
MKVERTTPSVAASSAAQPFKDALRDGPRPALQPVALSRGLRPVRALAGARSPAVLAVRSTSEVREARQVFALGRARVEAEATRLHEVRAAPATAAAGEVSAVVTRERRKLKVLELITRELADAVEGRRAGVANDAPPPRGPSPQPAGDPRQAHLDRAAAAVALIEKIQVFVKSGQRPALTLTLNNSLGAQVEIERLGPGLVAIKLVGRNGPPSPEAVSQVRDELAARGLKVGALSVE